MMPTRFNSTMSRQQGVLPITIALTHTTSVASGTEHRHTGCILPTVTFNNASDLLGYWAIGPLLDYYWNYMCGVVVI